MTTWRCFHCDAVFTDPDAARIHFGSSERQEPVCEINAAKYREMEERVARSLEEDTDLHREIHRLQSEHRQALMREEEKGYARGLRDGWEVPREWLPMETAPTDGTLVRLLVDYSDAGEHPLEDADEAPTIGANNDGNVGAGEGVGWQFAGWSWQQDVFTQGEGRPIGWLPYNGSKGAASTQRPLDMVLHCPACGLQHIDEPKPCTIHDCASTGFCYAAVQGKRELCDSWPNRPHRSHQCQGCKFEWRPADVPTNGVAAVKTRGEHDGPLLSECQIAQNHGSCNCVGACKRGLEL